MHRPYLLICIFVVSLLAAACGDRASEGAPNNGGPVFPPMDVQTVTVAARPLPQTSEYVATVRSLRSTTVQPQVEGVVRRIFVRAGDTVRSGQPLVQIDPDRQQATVAATESQRISREADVALARQ